jgi:DNA repair protein RadC
MPSLQGYSSNLFYQQLISDENIQRLQVMITKELEGVHPLGIPIVVKKQAIRDVMNNSYESKSREHIGDMFSRHHQNRESLRCDYDLMNQETFNKIVKSVKSDLAQQSTYQNLSIWTSEDDKQRFASVKLNDNKIKTALIPQRF